MSEIELIDKLSEKDLRPLGPASPAIVRRLALIEAGALRQAAAGPRPVPADPVDAAIVGQAERALDFDVAPWVVLGVSLLLWLWLVLSF